MKAELEALVAALDAVMESRGGDQAERLKEILESHIEVALAKRPGVSRAALMAAVDLQYRRWLKTQRQTLHFRPKPEARGTPGRSTSPRGSSIRPSLKRRQIAICPNRAPARR